MEIGILLSLFVVTFLNAAVPGPGIIYVAGVAARFGGLNATRVVLGIVLGTALLFSVSFAITVGAVSVSDQTFGILQWAGVFVLAYLAWILWPRSEESTVEVQKIYSGFFWTGVALSLSQPLSLVFLLAIVPQFITGENPMYHAALALGSVVLGATGLAMAGAALCGNSLSKHLRRFHNPFLRLAAVSLVVFSALSALAAVGYIGFGLTDVQ